MNIQWVEVIHVLIVWSAYIALYGLVALSVIVTALIIHTRITKDYGCNIKMLRKILS